MRVDCECGFATHEMAAYYRHAVNFVPPHNPARETAGVGTRASGHGCILAIVGSRTLAGESTALMAILGAFDGHQPRSFVSGGAPGIDQMAEKEAKRRGIPRDIKRPKAYQWDGPGGFKERNQFVAEVCECLVEIYDPASPTHGSAFTAEFAQAIGKKVERYPVERRQPSRIPV